MLNELNITGLGVIDKARLRLGPGLTVITGETGAGKTMLISALNLLFGSKASEAIIRPGSEAAQISAVFAPKSKSELIINRLIPRSGRARFELNAHPVAREAIEGLSSELLALHGQSGQLKLKSSAIQRQTLDQFAKNGELLARYQKAFTFWQKTKARREALVRNRGQRLTRAAGLKMVLAEIENINPKHREDEELEETIRSLDSASALLEELGRARKKLSRSENSAIDSLAQIGKILTEAKRLDPNLAQELDLIEQIVTQAETLDALLIEKLKSLPIESLNSLDSAHARLADLRRLQKKYGPSLDSVIAFAKTSRTELDSLEISNEDLEKLAIEEDTLAVKTKDLAQELRQKRETAAKKLSLSVNEELKSMALGRARFFVDLKPAQLDAHGADQISLKLQTDPAHEPQPLERGASGGELSRIMLGLEVSLAGSSPVPTMIFDEIDAGIGGAVAIEVGKRLAQLARHTQVIVITHLAQVAAFANQHIRVKKDQSQELSITSVESLEGQERKTELARLLSGLSSSSSGLEHVGELLELAREWNRTQLPSRAKP